MSLRQTSVIITWNDDARPELLDGEEWAYVLRMGGVDVEHAIVGEDLPLPADAVLAKAVACAEAWAANQ